MASSAIICVALAAVPAIGQQAAPPSAAIARSVPPAPDPRHVFVLDSAHLLTDADISALQDSALALQAGTGADLAFITLPSLHGGAVEDAALTIGRLWKIGSAGALGDATASRGVVVLYVPDKSTVAGSNLRVEVGRGLEGAITDGGGSRAILEAMKPGLRAKRYGDGFMAGFGVVAAMVRAENAVVPRTEPSPPPPGVGEDVGIWTIVVIAMLFALAVVCLVPLLRKRHRGSAAMLDGLPPSDTDASYTPSLTSSDVGMWSGGGDSGGGAATGGDSSGSFGGGGGFSGGGASDTV